GTLDGGCKDHSQGRRGFRGQGGQDRFAGFLPRIGPRGHRRQGGEEKQKHQLTMDINTVTLTGRLGRDIELRQTAKGTSVANVSLAVESGFGDNRKTNWIGLDFWGKAAESAAQYLRRGRKIAV